MRIELPEWGERTSEERREMFREGHAHSVRGRYMTIVALVELEESRGFLDLGYRSVQEFARREGGWSRRQVSYLLSAGRRLKELWRVDAALRDGSLCWSKVRLVVSVATAATEEEWLQKAMTMTTDQLEHHVQSVREPIVRQSSAKGRVLLPSIPQRLYRKYQELLKELRAQREQPHLDDERGFEELLNLAARALGREDLVDKQPNQDLDAHQGETNRGDRAAATVATVPTLVESSSIDKRIEQMARTAHPTYTLPDPRLDPHPDARSLPWRDRRWLFLRAGYACEICGNTLALEMHHRIEHQAGGARDPMNLTVTCRRCHEATHQLMRRRQAETKAINAT